MVGSGFFPIPPPLMPNDNQCVEPTNGEQAMTEQTSTRRNRRDRTVDEQQIREVLARASHAWADNDAGAYAAEFTPDSDYVAFDGTWLRGREANRALHSELFAGVLYGTRIEGDIESVRFLTDDIAIAHMTGSVAFAWQPTVPKGRLSRNTWVLRRDGDDWRIEAFHNTRVRPMPGDNFFARMFARYVRWRTERTAAITGQTS